MIEETISYYSQIEILEWIAVISALAYVIFAAKENILCWPAALISTALYTVVFYEYYLWMDSLLQVYYFAMAIFGWYCWQRNINTGMANHSGTDHIQITEKPLTFHIKAIVALALVSVVVGYVMDNYTPTSFPYIDATTTVFAVFSTYLVTQKVLENWLYWIVIDLVSIYIYIEKDLQPTASLFVIYVFIAIYGYISWSSRHKELQIQTSEA